MKEKFNTVGWSLVGIGALIIIFSFIYMQDAPLKCSASVWDTITSSFLTFGVGMALMMIGFAKLYVDRWSR